VDGLISLLKKKNAEGNHRFSPWEEDVVATNAADNSGREKTRSTLASS